jgi:hypothetical protein
MKRIQMFCANAVDKARKVVERLFGKRNDDEDIFNDPYIIF